MVGTMRNPGTFIHGIAASEHLDSSGERIIIKGIDISRLTTEGVFNFEHKSETTTQIVGKILEATKIYKESDCLNEHHLFFWNQIHMPYLYVAGELFDGVGHRGAEDLAALLRYDAQGHINSETRDIVNFSIEGQRLEKRGHLIHSCIARKITITTTPCNKVAGAKLKIDNNNAEDKEIITDSGNFQLFQPLMGKNEVISSCQILKKDESNSKNFKPKRTFSALEAPRDMKLGDRISYKHTQKPQENQDLFNFSWNKTNLPSVQQRLKESTEDHQKYDINSVKVKEFQPKHIKYIKREGEATPPAQWLRNPKHVPNKTDGYHYNHEHQKREGLIGQMRNNGKINMPILIAHDDGSHTAIAGHDEIAYSHSLQKPLKAITIKEHKKDDKLNRSEEDKHDKLEKATQNDKIRQLKEKQANQRRLQLMAAGDRKFQLEQRGIKRKTKPPRKIHRKKPLQKAKVDKLVDETDRKQIRDDRKKPDPAPYTSKLAQARGKLRAKLGKYDSNVRKALVAGSGMGAPSAKTSDNALYKMAALEMANEYFQKYEKSQELIEFLQNKFPDITKKEATALAKAIVFTKEKKKELKLKELIDEK